MSVKSVPKQIDGANVVVFTPIDARHRPTGNCRQVVRGVLQGPASGLAICSYEEGFLLFGCDADWNNITDTWHPTLEEAMNQAEFEYDRVSRTWQKPT